MRSSTVHDARTTHWQPDYPPLDSRFSPFAREPLDDEAWLDDNVHSKSEKGIRALAGELATLQTRQVQTIAAPLAG